LISQLSFRLGHGIHIAHFAPQHFMNWLFATSFLLAVVGTSVELSWASLVSEPVRIAIWGLTLLAFSSALRALALVPPKR
jgi:hypothetical protein